ncbi:lysylphosphatidylglycerol synthase transmembrane domain-containing protein [Thiohalophilus sp.]|uniref:lysylphosphatidylglycerol synthase transmembrane domain-containing protein n=1 Tax=Thiohalophilus sp. TaxID=3028392 RepID=UPI002ACE4AA6|nr:lysylphosphatidylglycerol synthase transmembrane domain-containing protein [Thiohalophilus sp.]MDZ7662168.1 lysylphosphatidylglycerol synthase transmembrane domain-containing protein [Thiohalophilus sp.]
MPRPALLTLNRHHLRLLAISLVLAAGLYLGFALVGGLPTLGRIINQLGLSGGLILLAASLGNYLLRFARWAFYLHSLHHRLPGLLHLGYYLSGFALTTTPAKAGETIRSLYLKRHGVPYTDSLASFFVERFLDVVVITLFATLLFIAHRDYRLFIALVLLTLLILLPLLQSRLPLRLCHYLAQHFANTRLAVLLTHLANMLHQAHRLLLLRRLYPGLLLGALAWLVQGLAFYYLLQISETSLPLATALGIYALSLLAGALSFIPGGIGATEAVMALLLLAHGVERDVAFSLPVINRVTTLWFAVALGLLSNALLAWRGIRPADDTPVKPAASHTTTAAKSD